MKQIILLFLLFISQQTNATNSSQIIYISSQLEFNNLSQNIQNAVKQKVANIKVVFDNGTYYYNDQNKLKIENNQTSNISFIAKQAGKVQLVSDGEDYSISQSVGVVSNWYKVKIKRPLDIFCTFQTTNGNALFVGDTGYLNDTLQTNISNAAIELVDSVKKLARIKLPDKLSFLKNKKRDFFKNSQLCYKAQWSDCYRDILYTDNSYLYFTLTDGLTKYWERYVTNMYNWTMKQSKNPPYQPFFITNIKLKGKKNAIFYDDKYIYIPNVIKRIHVCRYGEFMALNNSRAKLVFQELTFIGSKLGLYIKAWPSITTNKEKNGLIKCLWSNNILFSHCKFMNMGGSVISLYNAQNIEITNCLFQKNYNDNIIETFGRNRNIKFSSNKINNPSKILTYRMAISLDHTNNVLIDNNDVANISRAFVRVGICDSVFVRNNNLYTTQDVSRYHIRNFSSDTGVLVYGAQNSPFIAENNIVHDLPSNLLYNGIMVDNGSGNATIRGNLFYNIGDRAIYCWRHFAVSKSNFRNVLESNVILGNVSYGGYNKYAPDNASFSKNIFVRSPHYQVLQNSEATDRGDNMWIETFRVNGNKVYLPKNAYLKITKDKNIDYFIKQYLVEKK